MLRRIVLTAVASVTALSAAPSLAHADAGPLILPALFAAPDRLTVTIADAANGTDGTYELECNPQGGTHPNPEGACGQLGRIAAEGHNPFAPVPKRAMCTMQFGGRATAHVTGTWRGHRVDADFKRTDGCEIARWNALVPVLPAVGRA